MKAERRHELQTNSLALWLQIRLPEYWQKYGNHILLGLILVIGAFWFIRWRIEAPKKAAAQAGQVLAIVDQRILELRRMQRMPGEEADIPQRIAEALNTSDNKDIQALGYALLGDYHWTLASLPQGMTSMPAKSSPEDLYKQADDAFRLSLATGSKQMDLVARAHFGRALIAEQQAFDQARKDNFKGDPAKNPFWQTAKAEYEAVANAPEMLTALRDEAKAKVLMLEKMQKPVWIAKASPTSLPASLLGPETPTLSGTYTGQTTINTGTLTLPATRPTPSTPTTRPISPK